jgi:hypothetical protein
VIAGVFYNMTQKRLQFSSNMVCVLHIILTLMKVLPQKWTFCDILEYLVVDSSDVKPDLINVIYEYI